MREPPSMTVCDRPETEPPSAASLPAPPVPLSSVARAARRAREIGEADPDPAGLLSPGSVAHSRA